MYRHITVATSGIGQLPYSVTYIMVGDMKEIVRPG